MPNETREIAGTRLLVCAAEGPTIAHERDALDVIGDALAAGADVVALPVARLDPAFFKLSTGLAGGVLQKFVNYKVRVAVVGDITAEVEESGALRDLVTESNRGRAVWFVATEDELTRRLHAEARPQ